VPSIKHPAMVTPSRSCRQPSSSRGVPMAAVRVDAAAGGSDVHGASYGTARRLLLVSHRS
jgi:hypothetical protein